MNYRIVYKQDNVIIFAGRIFTHEIECNRNCKQINKFARLIKFPGIFEIEPIN